MGGAIDWGGLDVAEGGEGAGGGGGIDWGDDGGAGGAGGGDGIDWGNMGADGGGGAAAEIDWGGGEEFAIEVEEVRRRRSVSLRACVSRVLE